MQYTSTSTVDNHLLNSNILVTQWCTSNTDEIEQYNIAYNTMMAALYCKANTGRIENTFMAKHISRNSFSTTNKTKPAHLAIINSITTYCN